jgi:hypothetical protein
MGAKRRVKRAPELRGPTPREWHRLREQVNGLLEWAAAQNEVDGLIGVMASTTKPPKPPPKFRRAGPKRRNVGRPSRGARRG